MNFLPRASEWIGQDARRDRPRRDTRLFKSIWLGERRTRWVIGSGVVLLHMSILAFLAKVSPRWHAPRETASTLVLLDLATAVPKLTEKPVAQRSSKVLPDDGDKRQSNAAEVRESGQFDQTPQSASTGPLTDWSAELETIAKAEAPELLAERLQKCHDAELHGRSLVGCGKVKTPGIWETHRGLAGFFAVGKRVANGHIFDDMNDPDRERSSVPDIVALQKAPHRPLPLAFDPRRDYFTH